MLNIDNDIFPWIEAHQHLDPDKLLLRYANDPKLKFAILQIICRKKAAKKLADTLSCKHFIFPTTLSAEQCTSDAAAKYHASLIDTDTDVIDFTCGLGIDSFAMAKKAKSVTAYERQPDLVDAAMHNAAQLGLTNFRAFNADSVSLLETPIKADVIFIDPARRDNIGKRVFGLHDCSPDVTAIMPQLLRIAPQVIVKASPMLDINHTLSALPHIHFIIALGTPTECKELIIICNRDYSGIPVYKAATITGPDTFLEYIPRQAEESEDTYGTPQIGAYLYEPYPAVMKLIHHSRLTKDFNVIKCDRDSHLFFSDTIIDNFPGHKFKIIAEYPFNKASIREVTRLYPRINVTCRNFPITAPELTSRLRLKSDDRLRLFATTCCGQRRLIISASSEP